MICSPAGISFTLIIELVCACNFCTILLWSLEHFYSSQDRQLHYNVFVWSLLWLLLLLLWFVRSYLMFNYLVTFTFFSSICFGMNSSWLCYILFVGRHETHMQWTRECAHRCSVCHQTSSLAHNIFATHDRNDVSYVSMWWMTNKSVQSS